MQGTNKRIRQRDTEMKKEVDKLLKKPEKLYNSRAEETCRGIEKKI